MPHSIHTLISETDYKKKYQATVLSSGIASGKAFIFTDILNRDLSFYDIRPSQVDQEYSRIETAITRVSQELEETALKVEQILDRRNADIFRTQRTILNDPNILRELKNDLRKELFNAERIVQTVFHRWERLFKSLDRQIIQDRGDDIADVGRRLLKALIGLDVYTLDNIPAGSILIAKTLLPSDMVRLTRNTVNAVILESCGETSHAALLSREMNIPLLSGLSGISSEIRNGDQLLLDCCLGVIYLDPVKSLLDQYCTITDRLSSETTGFSNSSPLFYTDGKQISVYANVSSLQEAVSSRDLTADGIGLLRLENFFLKSLSMPSEDQITLYLKEISDVFPGLPVCIRLLDLGGDKFPGWLQFERETNPFLGVRGIRFLLRNPNLLKLQLKSILFLPELKHIRIMLPMVTLPQEVKSVRDILNNIASEHNISIIPPLGVMLETPASALDLKSFLPFSDFFSIGTNDLSQYLLAADRNHPDLKEYQQDNHSSVFRLIRIICEEADNRPVSICGELAADTRFTSQLLNSGIREFSVSCSSIPNLKKYLFQFSDSHQN